MKKIEGNDKGNTALRTTQVLPVRITDFCQVVWSKRVKYFVDFGASIFSSNSETNVFETTGLEDTLSKAGV